MNPCALVRTLDPITLVVVALFVLVVEIHTFEIESVTDTSDINGEVLAMPTEGDTGNISDE